VGNTLEKPPPDWLQTTSSPTWALVLKSVPPTAVTYGLDAGKSGWYFSAQPVRPHTPWSPEAKSTEMPRVASFANCAFTAIMKAVLVCCTSSFP
jgi:hypothetical protein